MAKKKTTESKAVVNPGAALGQAIGEMMEISLVARMQSLAKEHGCHYIGPDPDPNAKNKIVQLQDEFGTKYRIDAVIANDDHQPLVLLESKYIRYKKHNRDKGSWICHTHRSLRNRFHSIRKSVAVLAGSWTRPSVAMIQSAQVNVFLVPYEKISALLAAQGVEFDWGEQERDRAVHAWMTYDKLSFAVKRQIAEDMIADIESSFNDTISLALRSDAKPKIKDVVVEFHATTGEIRREHFDSVEEAAFYLNDANAANIFDLESAPTMRDSVNDKDVED